MYSNYILEYIRAFEFCVQDTEANDKCNCVT